MSWSRKVLVHPQRLAQRLGVGVAVVAPPAAQRALLLGDGTLPFLDGPLALLDGASILAVTWAITSAASVTDACGSSTNLNWILLPLLGVKRRVRDQVPVGQIAEVTQGSRMPPRAAVRPSVGAAAPAAACRPVIPGRGRHLVGRGRHVAGRSRGCRSPATGAPLAVGPRPRECGPRNVRDGRGAGLTLRRRSGHLGGFLAGAPGAAEHAGLGRLMVRRSVGAGHGDRVVLVPGRQRRSCPSSRACGPTPGRSGCRPWPPRPAGSPTAGWTRRPRGRRAGRPPAGHPRPSGPRMPGRSGLVRDGLILGALVLLVCSEPPRSAEATFWKRVIGRDSPVRAVLGFVLWDDVAVYDVAGSPRLAVLVLGHSNHLSRECLKVYGCLPGRVRGPAGVLRGSLLVPCWPGPGRRRQGPRGRARRFRGVRSAVGDGVTVVGAVADGRDAGPWSARRGPRAGRVRSSNSVR